MKKTVLLYLISIFIFSLSIKAQVGFQFKNKADTKQRISFKLINNLVVIPLEINGKKLSFILDSGVGKTILFNLTKNDSIGLNNIEKVELQGLGGGKPVEAFLSQKNKISLKNIESNNQSIYVVLKDDFDLSAKMGVTIHGIIGYSLLRNFIVKVNYSSRNIIFYHKKYEYKECKKCEVFPIQFYRKKPFINAQVQLDTIGNTLTDVKLLVDSGGSDAIWLFEDSKENIRTPNKYFKDILGEGLSGTINGNRSRIPKIQLKSFEISGPTASFLDTISTKRARSFKQRNGSIGAEILKRFVVWFDYPNQKLTLKKKGSFNSGFNYNMSGLDIVYNGKQLVRLKDTKSIATDYNQQVSESNSINFITSFSYRFKPSYIVKNVVKNSPAYNAGLRKNDIVITINNRPTYDLNLSDITYKLQEKNGKKIKMVVDRNGEKMKFQFRLKKRI